MIKYGVGGTGCGGLCGLVWSVWSDVVQCDVVWCSLMCESVLFYSTVRCDSMVCLAWGGLE